MKSRNSFSALLNQHEVAFVDACKQVLSLPLPEFAAYGLFWFQIDDTVWDKLPLGQVWCEADGGAETVFPSPFTLTLQETWTPPDDLGDDEIFSLLCAWIQRCWQIAGGPRSRVPFYVFSYHSGESFCPRRNRLVSEAEIEAEVGPI